MLLTRLGMHSMSRLTGTPAFARQLYTFACSASASSITTACIHSCSRAKTHITLRFSAYTPFSVHIKITPPIPRLHRPTHKLPNTSNNKYLTSRPNYETYTTPQPSSSWEISSTQSLTTPSIAWASTNRHRQLTSLNRAFTIPLTSSLLYQHNILPWHITHGSVNQARDKLVLTTS